MSLPKQRDPEGPYRVVVVCLGNICRSPMAEKVLRSDLDRAGLGDRVEVTSSGTGHWHVGGGMDPRAASTLRVHGYTVEHTARQFRSEDLADADLVLAMDLDNHDEVASAASEYGFDPERLRLFRSFAAGTGANPEVPDPYYGGDDGFTAVLTMIESAAKGLTDRLAEHLNRED